MRYLMLFLLVLASSYVVAAEGHPEQLDQGLINPGHHDKPSWFRNSFLDIGEDVAEAATENRRVILYMYQDGCPYCAKLLNDNFGNKTIADKTQKHFEVIAINIWGDREVTGLKGEEITEKAFVKKLGVQFTPTLLYLNEKGKTLLRVNGYFPPHKFMATLDYMSGQHENKMSFREFYAKANPVKASGKLHQETQFLKPPYDLSSSSKPMLVMFEQKQCPACDELHSDVLKRKEVRASFDNFDVALLDIWSNSEMTTPNGKKTTIKKWVKELGIQYAPTLVFFNKGGKEVFRTDAYLKTFHTHAALDYVLTSAYKTQPEFQRYIQQRAEDMEAQGIEVDIMK